MANWPDSFFKVLNEQETREFQQAALDQYVAQDPISPAWHPVYRATCEHINRQMDLDAKQHRDEQESFASMEAAMLGEE